MPNIDYAGLSWGPRFSPEEIGILENVHRLRYDLLSRFLRWWLCRGVWNSEPPLHIDPRELEDKVRNLIIAQKLLDSWHPGSDGLVVKDII